MREARSEGKGEARPRVGGNWMGGVSLRAMVQVRVRVQAQVWMDVSNLFENWCGVCESIFMLEGA